MSYFFTNHFRTELAKDQNIMDLQKVKVVLFRNAPAMGYPNAAWTGSRTVAELVASSPGWSEVVGISGYPLTYQLDVSTRTFGGSRYVMFSDYKFSGLGEVAEVQAIGIVRVAPLNGVSEPLIFVTNTPVGGVTNISPGDALTASPDSTFPDATNRWLMGWGVATPDPTEGPLVFSLGSPEFEVSGSQHVWLYPQRANMIANPSFEAVGTNFWSANGPITRVSGGAPGAGAWAGTASAPAPGYLTSTVGTVSTPDPATVPAQSVWVARLQGPTKGGGATDHTLVSQWEAEGTRSYSIQRHETSGYFSFTGSNDGNAGSANTLNLYGAEVIEWVAIARDFANGNQTMTVYSSADGKTWTEVGGGNVEVADVFNSTGLVRIGALGGGTLPWDGRIYSVEHRTGLNPAAGTVLWRFDASDYSGTGTSYVDPRGRTWTLSNASAITPKTGDVSAGGVTIMESNTFSTRMGDHNAEQWTVQLMAKGVGKLKVGLVHWDADYRSTAVDWGTNETWDLAAGAWTHVTTHRRAPEAAVAMVRLELQGTSLTIDRVLAERGYLKDWLYFDGDERYGARDDFSWYGGTNRHGATYSLWYNHRKAVTGRLFARTVDPNDPSQNVTDEDMEEQGLVYRWVPAGITVVPHMDVFYPFDPQNPLPPKAAGVLPYATVTPDGVPSPWS